MVSQQLSQRAPPFGDRPDVVSINFSLMSQSEWKTYPSPGDDRPGRYGTSSGFRARPFGVLPPFSMTDSGLTAVPHQRPTPDPFKRT